MADDFLTADIDDLLEGEPQRELSADEKAYQALLAEDDQKINKFHQRKKHMNWPEPVTKRWTR